MDLVFKAELMSGDKKDCPCCGRYAQVYKRHINATIARQLIMMYEREGFNGQYVHASNLIPSGQTGAGDLTKARYFGLIKEMPETSSHKKSSGYWSLTEEGKQYVMGKISVPSYVLVFDDRVLGVSQESATIKEALKSGGFNYSELMEI